MAWWPLPAARRPGIRRPSAPPLWPFDAVPWVPICHPRPPLSVRAVGEVAAARLGIAVHTVRTHVKNAMAKLGAHSKLEAVLAAIRLGLIEPRD